jgi:hypothetical protein
MDSAAPVILSPNNGNTPYNKHQDENGTAVNTIGTTTDNAVTYSIDGVDKALFQIDSNGVLTFKNAPDYENPVDNGTNNRYEVSVQIEDASGNTGSQSMMYFVVIIDDVNEYLVSEPIDIDAAANEVEEGSITLRVVGVTAFAEDQDGTNNEVTYALLDDAEGRFQIDSNTGVVTTSSFLDYEEATSHTITVNAISQDGSGSIADFTINILDVNEAPYFSSGSFDIDMNEGETTVGVFTANDHDAGDSLTYSIQPAPTTDGGLFDIDANTGELSFKVAPDYENPQDGGIDAAHQLDNNYSVLIAATDTGGLHANTVVHIQINDIIEGHSGKSHKAKSGKKACKDTRAINFSNVGQHDQSLCKYADEKKEEVEKKVEKEVEKKVETKVEEKVQTQVSEKCSAVKKLKGLLRVGSRGDVVRALQEFLNNNGFNAGKVDGIFGKITKAAVIRMQKTFGAVADGIVGPETKSKISCK